MNLCQECNKAVQGRVDKKFCDEQCRAAYHYRSKKNRPETLFARIDKQIKLNRRLIKKYNLSGKSTVRATKLEDAGFDPAYFTHFWRNNKDKAYLFCYDVGFLPIEHSGIKKYILIDWQDYMIAKRPKHS